MKVQLIAAVLALAVAACETKDEAASSGSSETTPPQTVRSDPPRQVAVTSTTSQQTYAPGSQDELNATIGDRVFFGFDRYDLSSEARASVASWAQWMNTHQNVELVIEGHTDERGTREYNLALGARRANAVKDYMVALGVAASRVKTISFGKERPAVLGSNEAAWAQNRRAVAVVQ